MCNRGELPPTINESCGDGDAHDYDGYEQRCGGRRDQHGTDADGALFGSTQKHGPERGWTELIGDLPPGRHLGVRKVDLENGVGRVKWWCATCHGVPSSVTDADELTSTVGRDSTALRRLRVCPAPAIVRLAPPSKPATSRPSAGGGGWVISTENNRAEKLAMTKSTTLTFVRETAQHRPWCPRQTPHHQILLAPCHPQRHTASTSARATRGQASGRPDAPQGPSCARLCSPCS